MRLPYTVGLVLAGMGLSLVQVRLQLHLSKDLIFTVFCRRSCSRRPDAAPPGREFKSDLPVVAVLASLGVLLAAAVTAGGMHYILDWTWGSSIIFGVLIAATDPVSVIATFKEAGVQGRLRLLIESESLLNDGTAAVGFVAVLSVLAGVHYNIASISGVLLFTIGGGVLIGAAVGFIAMYLAGQTSDYLVELTFTALAAYGSFFVAEHFGCSGVLAALTAGLVVGNYRPSGSISESGHRGLVTFWEFIAFVANSLIFILIGAQEAQQHFSGIWLPGRWWRSPSSPWDGQSRLTRYVPCSPAAGSR